MHLSQHWERELISQMRLPEAQQLPASSCPGSLVPAGVNVPKTSLLLTARGIWNRKTRIWLKASPDPDLDCSHTYQLCDLLKMSDGPEFWFS